MELASIDPADQPHVLARHVYELTLAPWRRGTVPEGRLQLVNALADAVEGAASASTVLHPARQLRRLVGAPGPGITALPTTRPKTPLSEAALLTNSPGEPIWAAELRAEIDTCDEVDLLCAFVKWHGLRLLEDELGRLSRRGAPLRVITTTYMGATERAALDRLVRGAGR